MFQAPVSRWERERQTVQDGVGPTHLTGYLTVLECQERLDSYQEFCFNPLHHGETEDISSFKKKKIPSFFFFNIHVFLNVYLFLAVLCLRCYLRALSSCSKQTVLVAVHRCLIALASLDV